MSPTPLPPAAPQSPDPQAPIHPEHARRVCVSSAPDTKRLRRERRVGASGRNEPAASTLTLKARFCVAGFWYVCRCGETVRRVHRHLDAPAGLVVCRGCFATRDSWHVFGTKPGLCNEHKKEGYCNRGGIDKNDNYVLVKRFWIHLWLGR